MPQLRSLVQHAKNLILHPPQGGFFLFYYVAYAKMGI